MKILSGMTIGMMMMMKIVVHGADEDGYERGYNGESVAIEKV